MTTDRAALVAALQDLGEALLPTKLITPIGLEHHRVVLAAMLRDGDDGPYREPFTFPDVDVPRVEAALAAVNEEAAPLPPELKALVHTYADETSAQAAVIASRDDARLTAWSVADSGLPTPATLQVALDILERPVPLDEASRTCDAYALENAVHDALQRHGIEGWFTEINAGMAAMASVNGGQQRISIRADVALTERDVRRLVAHEVGGHVLRWQNARRQPEPLVAFTFGNTPATEEGLAVLREREQGLESAENLRRYAVRVLGVVEAQHRGLLSLARFLLAYLDADDAADLALRLRRGITDPESPGGLTKDHGYLTGLLHLAERPADDIRLLRATKWGVDHLDIARQLLADGRLSVTDVIEYVPSRGRWRP
ncbi:MAG TPA: DUF1704 domain-containing protein [Arachnia sp.]|nr:DUF1704 domain-containing protein [Arachnia sp.]HMT84929.1 DUF1704 domain-containing protein [Arachnia sp.]